jgi:hypothetical protein
LQKLWDVFLRLIPVIILSLGGINMNKRIKCVPFPDIDNADVVISGHQSDSASGVKKCMTFFYGGPEIGAEWEPDYGPITVIHSCTRDAENAQEHYFYDYCDGYGSWSQLAVNEEGLGKMLIRGDYEGIFEVLKRWATR